MKLDFTRSNVNEKTLNVSNPRRSSFDLYHSKQTTLPIGRFIPANVEVLMPGSVCTGVIKPDFALETMAVPQIGPTRLDTHTIAVSARRIDSDWKKLIEGDVQTIPTVNLLSVFNDVAASLFGYEDFPSFRNQYYKDGSWDLSSVLSSVLDRYTSFIEDSSSFKDYGYLRDFFAAERDRLSYFNTSATDSGLLYFIHEVMSPYFGEGSILDLLQYPIFSYYGVQLTTLNLHPLLNTIASWSDFFSINGYKGGSNPGHTHSPESDYIVNEMFIRAQYAAWFDALRNWHIEDKSSLPNPDNWGSSSIFVDGDTLFYTPLIFLVPRYRTYGNDLFTTIQTDDIFRHVFNPIIAAGNQMQVDRSMLVSDPKFMDSIFDTLSRGVSTVFPQGLFKRDENSVGTIGVYMNDLQTMRRAGMLERFLARDYFFPDTYAGQCKARWGVEASDLLGVTSQYISGSEQFISGSQQISNNTTTDGLTSTVAGTRTFVGGASSTENVSFASNGDFIYLVTFVSLQPIVNYDALNMHLYETTRADLPFPEFADDTRVQIQAKQIIRGLDSSDFIGFVPRYIQYRGSLDSVHGRFLRDYRPYCWLRDWYNNHGTTSSDVLPKNTFSITAYGLHVHVNLDAFNDVTSELHHIAYGKIDFNLAVECPLPAAIENL